MSQHVSAPNTHVQKVYEELGTLLEQGDDVFVEQGPEIVKSAMKEPGFFDGVETEHAGPDEYTRAKVIGEPGGHVIRFMEWPPEYTLCPHEHHGRPCFEVLVDGLLSVVNIKPQPVDDERYRMEVVGTELTRPGESAVIDPRENDVHAVYSPVRSRSLHVYPEDKTFAYGYELVEDDDAEEDYYTRERFELGGGE
jgi:hypothetical protein